MRWHYDDDCDENDDNHESHDHVMGRICGGDDNLCYY